MYRESVYLLFGCLFLGTVITGEAKSELVGWWRFDEDSGTIAIDSSGNGNDGTIEGGAQRVAGRYNEGIRFNGSNTLVRAPYIPLNSRSFTVAMWINPVLYTGEQVIFSQRQRSGLNTDLHFRLGGPGGGDAPARGVRMGFYGNDLNTRSGVIRDNDWYHITFRYDFENRDRRIYLNGIQQARDTAEAYLGTSGDTVIGSWAGISQWFKGIIDDVRVYDHALTDTEIQSAMSGFEGYSCASDPNPADGALHTDTWATLSWEAGDSAVSHDVYFGDNFDDVNDGTGRTFRVNQTNTDYYAGLPGYPEPDGLVPGTRYYWRIDEVQQDGLTRHKGDIWSFVIPSREAYNPSPGQDEKNVYTGATLTWQAGLGAHMHTVYFGEDPRAVADAADGTVRMISRYYPGDLEFDKTYYWRVDEYDGTMTHKGDVWSFTTMEENVSSGAAYYVDACNPLAGDGNPGTETRPFKTIGKGARSLQPGDVLFIKAGIYRESVDLTRSGTQKKPIRIKAYPGDKGRVIINAAEPVTDWFKCTGPGDCAGNPYWEHIYVAEVVDLVNSHPDGTFAIRQVFQNGLQLNRSRYPDTGCSYPTGIEDSGGIFSDNSLSRPAGYFNGSVCHIKTQVWQINQIEIADYSGNTINLSKSPRYDISTRFGYYITNVVGEINSEGEWAYEPATKRLFIWPKNGVAEDIEITYRDYCLRTYAGVSSICVRGLVMKNAYRYGVWICRANDIRIEDNTVEHAYEHGIYVEGWGGRCDDNHIVNNTVRYACYYGIVVDGDCYNSNVQGNYVSCIGTENFNDDLMNGRGEGIFVGGPFTLVYNNRIDRTGHTGLYLSGPAAGREVSCNYITNNCLSLSDSGAIYMAGFAEGPQEDWIHHNICEDIVGCLSMDGQRDVGSPPAVETHSGDAPGLYIDEEGNHRILENNTVINSHMTGLHFHWAPDNVVRHNTFYANRDYQVFLSGKDSEHKRLEDEAFCDNVMFACETERKTLFLAVDYNNVQFGQSDNNYYYNPYDDEHIFVHRRSSLDELIMEHLTLRQWRELSGCDANSKDFSYLEQMDDITINPEKPSRIIYNTSLEAITVELEPEKYCDVDGNKIYGSVSLQPFESLILIPCDFEIP